MEKTAKRWGIQFFECYIGGNHIHLALRVPSRKAYIGFIKAFTGTLAKELKIAFDHRPWTRIASWGRDFKSLCRYIRQNFHESLGVVAYKRRGKSPARQDRPPTYEDWMDALA